MKRAFQILLFAIPLCLVAQVGLRDPGFVSKLNSESASIISDEPFDGLVSTNGLVAYWPMHEVSAGTSAVTRLDVFGGLHFTDNAPYTASATGLITNAANLEIARSNYLSRADATLISLGTNVDFSIAAWVKLRTLHPTAGGQFICKDSAVAGGREYNLFYSSSTNRLGFVVGRPGSTTVDVSYATNTGGPQTNLWYFMVGTLDTAANEQKIFINGTLDTTITKTIDAPNSATIMTVGRNSAGSSQFDGLIQDVSFWRNRVLSSTDVSNLYNGGLGRTY